jgi:regulator of protease activity HflC (stomatin/prohibitin superfamily)
MPDEISNDAPNNKSLFIYGFGALLAICVILLVITILKSGITRIEPDERGVVISAFEPKGYRSELLEPGLHIIIPFVEITEIYSVAPQNYTMSEITATGKSQDDSPISARTKDDKVVEITASVVYSINPAKVINLHITWQNRYQSEFVRPLTRGITRDIVSQHYSFDLVENHRIEIEQTIALQLR